MSRLRRSLMDSIKMENIKKRLLERNKKFKALKKEKPKTNTERIDRLERLAGLK